MKIIHIIIEQDDDYDITLRNQDGDFYNFSPSDNPKLAEFIHECD